MKESASKASGGKRPIWIVLICLLLIFVLLVGLVCLRLPAIVVEYDKDLAPFLLGFSEGQIVSIRDETGRSYESAGKSYEEIVSSRSWTARSVIGPAESAPARRIELRMEGVPFFRLVYEEGAPGDETVCYLYTRLFTRFDRIEFRCGESLMDELMAWALAKEGEASAPAVS